MAQSPLALVTGAGGQDGTILTRELTRRGWDCIGVYSSQVQIPDDLAVGVTPVVCELADLDAARGLISGHRPTHVFHLAAVSSVAATWSDPVGTSRINAELPIALMAQCLDMGSAAPRFINASSGEVFAGSPDRPQTELSALAPASPYGAAKAYALTMGRIFRDKGLFCSNAILYNHESPFRAKDFVTRKITSTVAAISAGQASVLTLGNLDAQRDWGWAPDYVDAMIRMAEHPNPDDFVVATGVVHSVREFVAAAFSAVGMDEWDDRVEVSSEFFRPNDAPVLVGDAEKARTELGWRPTKTFEEIVAAMVREDLLSSEFC